MSVFWPYDRRSREVNIGARARNLINPFQSPEVPWIGAGAGISDTKCPAGPGSYTYEICDLRPPVTAIESESCYRTTGL